MLTDESIEKLYFTDGDRRVKISGRANKSGRMRDTRTEEISSNLNTGSAIRRSMGSKVASLKWAVMVT